MCVTSAFDIWAAVFVTYSLIVCGCVFVVVFCVTLLPTGVYLPWDNFVFFVEEWNCIILYQSSLRRSGLLSLFVFLYDFLM